ncbi:hypothetical protein GCM10009624_31620 [Gordonia sinesedis]
MTIQYSGAPISIGRPALQVALAGDPEATALPVIVRRPTLRDAQRARSLLRTGARDTANYVVALEIEVVIAADAASARAVAGTHAEPTAHAGREVGDRVGETVRYIGTPSGLISLIRDVYAAEVADAVLIVPLDGSATTALVRENVLPRFGVQSAA